MTKEGLEIIAKAKFGFIGAGKVGITLGAYLLDGGYNVCGYVSRTKESIDLAAKVTKTKLYRDIQLLINDSDIILITVPDDSIVQVWDDIKQYDIKGKVIAHTSGAKSSSVFYGAKQFEAYAFSIHPMHAFSEKNGQYDGLDAACFTIEGDCEKIEYVCSLFEELGNTTITVSKEKKYLYHAANVMVSNLVLSLIDIGTKSLIKCGVDNKTALKALSPLIENNVLNIIKNGIVKSLTGPVERNDIGTVKDHLQVLDEKTLSIYAELSDNLISIAQKKHPERDYHEMKDLLGDV